MKVSYLYNVKLGENNSLAIRDAYVRAKDAVDAMLKVRDWKKEDSTLKNWSIESVQVLFGDFIA